MTANDATAAESRRNEALTGLAGSLAHCADLDTVLAVGLDASLRAVGAELGGIYLLDEESRALLLTRHHRGAPPEYVAAVARFDPGEALVGGALRGDVPIVVHDASSRPEAREATRRLGLRSCVLVPLFARGRALGVLALGGREARDFPREDLTMLEAIGGMLGGAIETSRLLARTKRHLAQVEALREIDRAILEDRELGEVLSTIAREAGSLGGGDSALVLFNGSPEPKLAASHGQRALEALAAPGAFTSGPLPSLLREKGPASVAVDTSAGPARALVAPLRAGDEALGALVVVKRDGVTESEDLAILGTFAHQAAVALAKARAREAAGRHASQLYLVSAAAEIATSTLDVSALLGSIARYVQRAFEYPSVGVYRVDPSTREAVLEGAAGGETMPGRLRFGEGAAGWAAERGERALVRDVRNEPRFQSSGARRRALSALAVPVRLAGEVVAVIAAESELADAFDSSDVIALDAIAAQAASGIRNARLFEEKVRALRSLEILQEITNVLNSDLELDALLLRIARSSVEAVKPAQLGSVLLYDGDALTVRSSFGYPRPEALARVRLAFHEGLPGAVFVSGHGRCARSSASDWGSFADALQEATGEERSKGALCVPISLPEQKLGVLLLESLSSQAFSEEELRFAATLADQAAIAIGNALHLRKILELDRQRQNYLSNVSHELRTPLTVIQGYVEALRSGISGDPKHFLRIVEEQCRRLGRRIEEVLEVSRLEQGVAQRHVEWGPVSLPAIVRRVVQGLRQEALLKELRFSERMEDGLPPLPGDERLLQLLVSNLVENAVKFTPRGGGVEVGVRAEDGSLVLTVRDDGIGIPEEHRERIFDKFFTVSDGASRTHGGAGIGLYLAREVAAIHDGRIRVESVEGHGSLFEVRLPVRPTR